MYTPQDRLRIYLTTLKDYMAYDGQKCEKGALDSGFCSYFSVYLGIDVYADDSMQAHLPELYMQKPENREFKYWWWEPGLLPPRITALKAAIELLLKTHHELCQQDN